MNNIQSVRIAIVAALGFTGSMSLAAPGFVELADLTVSAPVIVHATVARGERLSEKDSPGLRKGHARMLITAAVDAAIVAPGAIPAELTWLWDAPLDAKGKMLVVADWSAIEGRVNPWLSKRGDKKLQQFRDGLDAYIVNAAKTFGRSYVDVTKA